MNRESLIELGKPRVLAFESNGQAGHVRGLQTKEFLTIRTLPAAEQDVRLVLLSLCDEQGTRLLTDAETPIVEALPIGFVNDTVRAVMLVNGISKEGFADAEKNSPTP